MNVLEKCIKMDKILEALHEDLSTFYIDSDMCIPTIQKKIIVAFPWRQRSRKHARTVTVLYISSAFPRIYCIQLNISG